LQNTFNKLLNHTLNSNITMEENRLKPMVKHDPKIFNDIYSKTHKLRKSLAAGIDARRFGVDYNEILSWFDVKFIYVFNKYYNEHNPEVLKGHIINALQLFKFRIIRAAYTAKHSQNIAYVEDINLLEDVVTEENDVTNSKDYFYNMAMDYFKATLSDNAYQLLEVELNPPPYILSRLTDIEGKPSKRINKIPNHLIAEYLGLGSSDKEVKYIKGLRKEVSQATVSARDYFQAKLPLLDLNKGSMS